MTIAGFLAVGQAIADHLSKHDEKGKRRMTRPAKWYAVAALAAFSTYAAKDYALRAYGWYVKVDTHVDIQSPAAVQTFRELEREVRSTAKDVAAVIKEQGEQKVDIRELRADIREIHAAVGARRDARRETDVDAEARALAAESFPGCAGCVAAAESAAVRAGVPPGVAVPARGDVPAGVGVRP